MRMSPPEPVAITLPDEWTNLDEVAEAMREQTGTPGVALAVVRSDAIIDVGVAGMADLADGKPLTSESRFHWGSTVKSVTGTVIAHLIAAGEIKTSTRVMDVFPAIEMHEAYRNATIAQLMRHEGGVPAFANFGPPELEQFARYSGTPAQKRLAFVTDLLKLGPAGRPGEKFLYSNAGITLAAVMAEKVTGLSWEDLVRAYVFEPAGMRDAGFGLPATPENPEGTRGYMQFPGGQLDPLPLGMFSEINPMLAPAGDISSSIGDFARYAQWHLRGLRDGVPGIAIAHTPSPDANALAGGAARYSYGWEVLEWPLLAGRRTHWHNGSNGAFYAEMRLVPEADIAVVIMSNSGGPIAFSAEKSLAAIIEHYTSQ